MLLNKQQDRPAETDDESDIVSHSSDSYNDMTDCSSVSDIEPDSDDSLKYRQKTRVKFVMSQKVKYRKIGLFHVDCISSLNFKIVLRGTW